MLTSQFCSRLAVILGCFISASSAWAEVGVTKDRILLGSSTALSGQLKERCAAFKLGSELYLDAINKSGGIHGRKIEVRTYDDGYEPERTAANLKKLLEQDEVFALFQVHGTPTIKAVLPLIERADIPLITPMSNADFLRVPVNRNVFHVRAGFAEQARQLVDFIVKERKIERIGFFSQDDSAGTSAVAAFQSMMIKYDLKRTGHGRYKRNTLEVDHALEELASRTPDAVLLSGTSGPAAAFILKALKRNFRPLFGATSSVYQGSFVRELKDSDSEIYLAQDVPFLVAKSTPLHDELSKVLKDRNLIPDMAIFEGYLNARFLVEALKRAGPQLTRSHLRETIEQMQDVDLGGVSVTFSPANHQGLNMASLVRLRLGKLEPVPFKD